MVGVAGRTGVDAPAGAGAGCRVQPGLTRGFRLGLRLRL